jgi:hypothetical protein
MALQNVDNVSGKGSHVVVLAREGGEDAAEAVGGQNQWHLAALKHREGLLENLEGHESVVVGGDKQFYSKK